MLPGQIVEERRIAAQNEVGHVGDEQVRVVERRLHERRVRRDVEEVPSARAEPDQPVRVEPLASVLAPLGRIEEEILVGVRLEEDRLGGRCSIGPKWLLYDDAEVARLDAHERREQPLRDVARIHRANAGARADGELEVIERPDSRACRAA